MNLFDQEVIWYQEDAAFTYKLADQCRDAGKYWLARQIQVAAAHSSERARVLMRVENKVEE